MNRTPTLRRASGTQSDHDSDPTGTGLRCRHLLLRSPAVKGAKLELKLSSVLLIKLQHFVRQ